MTGSIAIPQTYRAMPRWWHGGGEWLAALPDLVVDTCAHWRLAIDGPPMHGSNALVVPVTRDGERLALRLTPPDERTSAEVRALQFWNGQGTVRLFDADVTTGVSLLERLDGERPLSQRPLAEAMPVIGHLMRRLAIPAPADVPSTGDLVAGRLATIEREWLRLGQPFSRMILESAIDAGGALTAPMEDLAVNGDLHCDQVLPGTREPWLAVDPVLLRGDIAYDLARILWTRLDEMTTDREIRHWLDVLVAEAGLDRPRALAAVRHRTVDYWLWGLAYGLTEDPIRCSRLAGALTQPPVKLIP